MADNLSVFTQRNANGQPTLEIANISDERNNSFNIIGIPGATYNLDTINKEVSAVTISGSSVSTAYNNTTNNYQTLESIVFTDSSGNTITLLGAPNTVYDLTLLPYLSAVVKALDMFAMMQFGDDYEKVKNEFLQRAGLI